MSETAVRPVAGVEELRNEIHEGLTRSQPELSPRFFYDQRGSELFERITELDEYYPTRTERALLETWAVPMMERLRPRALLEFGAGNAEKTRVLLDALQTRVPGARFVPLDVSGDFLRQIASQLEADYPGLEIVPEVADFTRPFQLANPLPRPALLAFLGGTLGNFAPPEARELLARVADRMHPEDRFLLGCDLRPGVGKTVAELEAAYDDRTGVTARFNLNMLRVLNRQAGTDFNEDDFRHRAFWNEEEGRIEMHLVTVCEAEVTVPERAAVRFGAGDSIRTEISCKYDRAGIDALFDRAGLRITDWLTDARERYALVIGAPA